MKFSIFSAALLLGPLQGQDLEIPQRVEPEIPDAWKEGPLELRIDPADLKIGNLGYRIEATNAEEDPDRQLVAILEGNGVGWDIVEVRGRYASQDEVEDWSLYYHEGAPWFAQLKTWKKISIAGEGVGDALSKVETFLAEDGKFSIPDEHNSRRILDMKSFAEEYQAGADEKEEDTVAPEPESGRPSDAERDSR